MLKSRGRTEETSVTEAEEWPQVVNTNKELFNRNKDYEQDQKGRSKRGVMPYAKREYRKTALCR